jgi:hypothetical protein|tara:strand:- start:442 stop:1662 length:1221 start_codon:yes stop_codon:yes gene_type:complete
MNVLLLIVVLLLTIVVPSIHTLRITSSTYDVQDIHLVHANQVRRFQVATIRISFDQRLMITTSATESNNNNKANQPILLERATPSHLNGLTRLRCGDHLIESCPSAEDKNDAAAAAADYHRGIGQQIPQFLYPLTDASVAAATHNLSTPFRTIVQTTHESEHPRDNQYVVVLVVHPKSALYTEHDAVDALGNSIEYHEEAHSLQHWNPDELSKCTLSFLKPEDQITPDGSTVQLSGDWSPGVMFHGDVKHMTQTDPPFLDVQEASTIYDDHREGIVHFEQLSKFANDLDAVLDLATKYDRSQEDAADILSGEIDSDLDLAKVAAAEKNSLVEDSVSTRVEAHIAKVSSNFAHSGMVVSLLEVMHRMGALESMETMQYWELIEDGLTNMMIPNFIKRACASLLSQIL